MRTTSRQAAIPGIIGGLGPLAHIAFERRLLAESARRGAAGDQDHPIWFLVSATDVPDRTESLAGAAERCTRSLVRYGRLLQEAGADFLVVACNTAHAFHRSVQAHLSIPWIHSIDRTAEAIARDDAGSERVGILATDGTLAARLYQESLGKLGLPAVVPVIGSEVQCRVMDAIYSPRWGVKATGIDVSEEAQDALVAAVSWLKERGATRVIAGCTELSAALASLSPERRLALPWTDPLDIAARVTLDLAFEPRLAGAGLAQHRRPEPDRWPRAARYDE
ncbi:amino acid racemase [Nannocystis sp. ILAH1]|uniref:aspartate/glutamate racemase family protein n=1 Tax=Nannocystis sp. ILAH1 TaxID=2996789 RepID=UPI002270734E|nr:amino acid racemase [Nannocystis sp. ILAH1]MCY0989533.1 amino acid racemase [Nannocystis sp. ILAH1]